MKFLFAVLVVISLILGCSKKTKYEPLYGKWQSDSELSCRWNDHLTNITNKTKNNYRQKIGHLTITFHHHGKGEFKGDQYTWVKPDGTNIVKVTGYIDEFKYRIDSVSSNRLNITCASKKYPFFPMIIYFESDNIFWTEDSSEQLPAPREYFRKITNVTDN